MSDARFILAGVMGWPVAHSRSPAIHNHWIAQYGLRGTYVTLPVQPERLAEAVRGLRALGFAGCNVTVPHKVAAMALMDDLHPVARRMAAINTIVVALLDEGVPEIRITNRTRERAEALAQEFGPRLKVVDWMERNPAMAGAQLLVNTTTQGMHGQPALDVALDDLPAGALVSDLVYIPQETPLLTAARQRGHRTVGGLGMLINQARPAFHAWFGVMPEVTPALQAAVQATF